MAETTDDVYGRLGTVVEDWNFQIVQSHEALARQIQTARSHLDRLVEPNAAPAEGATPPAGDGQEQIRELEAQVAQLTTDLQRARSAAPPMVGAPPSDYPEVDLTLQATSADALSEAMAALTEAREVNQTLQETLEIRDQDLSQLQESMAALTATETEAIEDTAGLEEKAAHEQALNLAQTQLAEAEARNDTLTTELTNAQEALAAAVVVENESTEDTDGAAEKAALEEALSLAQTQLADAETRNETLTDELATALKNAPSQDDLENAQEASNVALERCRSLEVTIAELEEALALAQQTPVESSDDGQPSEAFQEQLSALQEAHDTAQARIVELEEALANAQAATEMPHRNVDGSLQIEAFDAQGHKKRMGEILLELGVLDEDQLKAVLKAQSTDPQHRLGALVIEHGFTGEDIVAKILAAQLRLPYADIEGMEIDPEIVALVSPHVTRLHHCVPLREENGILTAAMLNPLDLIAIEDLELASGCRVSPVVSTKSQIDACLETLYPESD